MELLVVFVICVVEMWCCVGGLVLRMCCVCW